jgi:hypothetical protein
VPFNRENVKTPVAIADVEVHLYSPDPAGSEVAAAAYTVQVKYSTGEVRVLTGNLTPLLTQAQINGLLSFMADMRAKAIAEILPMP